MLKSGISLQFNNLHYVDIADGATNLSAYGEQYFTMVSDSIAYAKPPGPFPEYGRTRWVFDSNQFQVPYTLKISLRLNL